MDRALFRADPAELAVAGERPPERRHVGGDVGEREPDNQRLQGLDGGDADLVAAPAGEGQAVPLQAFVTGMQGDVGGGVIRAFVHRVRAVEGQGGRNADGLYAKVLERD